MFKNSQFKFIIGVYLYTTLQTAFPNSLHLFSLAIISVPGYWCPYLT